MVEFKVIISDTSTGKSSVKELKDKDARVLVGMKIGDELEGSVLDSDGTIRITGGSDRAGFPMRGDVRGGVKNYVLLTDGVGFRSGQKGEKRRKLVRGNTITDEIYQVNAVLVKDGVSQKPVAKTETKKPVAKTETKKPVAKKEAKKPVAKKEAKKPVAKTETKKPVAKTETKKPVAKKEAKKVAEDTKAT